MSWSRAFQKCIFFGHHFFATIFAIYNWVLRKKNQSLQICNFLQILKEEHKSFPMMYHMSWTSNMGFREGGGLNCPPSISWFSSTPAGKWYYRVQLNLTNNATQGNLAFVG